MKGLSNTQILELLARPAKGAKGHKPTMLVRYTNRDEDGNVVDTNLEHVAYDASVVGKFEGKAGSLRRTSKGNVTRNLNGRRAYSPNWDVEVVAYQA